MLGINKMNQEMLLCIIAILAVIYVLHCQERKQEFYDSGASSLIQPQGFDDINNPNYFQ